MPPVAAHRGDLNALDLASQRRYFSPRTKVLNSCMLQESRKSMFQQGFLHLGGFSRIAAEDLKLIYHTRLIELDVSTHRGSVVNSNTGTRHVHQVHHCSGYHHWHHFERWCRTARQRCNERPSGADQPLCELGCLWTAMRLGQLVSVDVGSRYEPRRGSLFGRGDPVRKRTSRRRVGEARNSGRRHTHALCSATPSGSMGKDIRW